MKALTALCFLLFLIGVGAFLCQLWFELWNPNIFAKILITDAGLFAVVFVLAFLIKENKEYKKIHSDNKLDF